jgi:hypothetical protein
MADSDSTNDGGAMPGWGTSAPPEESVATEVPEVGQTTGISKWAVTPIVAIGALVGAVVFGGLIGGAVGKSYAGGNSVAVVATTTTISPTTTSAKPVTSTTTTAARTPETVAVEFPSKFESSRSRVLTILQADSNIKSVDKFLFDPATGTVVLAETSAWASPDNQVTGAWEITRAIAALWGKPTGLYTDSVWMPNFQLGNTGKTYNCPADLMAQLADSRASRSDWATTCQ